MHAIAGQVCGVHRRQAEGPLPVCRARRLVEVKYRNAAAVAAGSHRRKRNFHPFLSGREGEMLGGSDDSSARSTHAACRPD